MITDALQFEFFRLSLCACLVMSVACGIIGSLIVVKEVSSISGGLSHAAFGGIGLGYLFGIGPMLGATIFSVILALVLGVLYLSNRESLETLVALVWSFGMALGVLAISLSPGYTADLTAYLFGNILLVSREFLVWAILLDIAVVLFAAVFFKELKAIAFDEEFSRTAGVRVNALFLLLMALIALTVVVLTRIVGMILTIAMLTIPALIARHWSRTLLTMVITAAALSAAVSIGGLFLSVAAADTTGKTIPPGPVIILTAIALYAVSVIARRPPRGMTGQG
jgi:zinc transport system permease protein